MERFIAVFVAGFTALATIGSVHAQTTEYYVLDGFGGVHAGGGAPAISPLTPYFGFDVAVHIEYVESAADDGVIVLDAFGGIHKGGALAAEGPGSGTPYFGFDVARGLAVRGSQYPPFRVIDSQGNEIGEVISGSANQSSVAYKVAGNYYPIALERTGFGGGSMYFASSDCSGPAFVKPRSPFAASVINAPGSTLYVESGPMQALAPGSWLNSHALCRALSNAATESYLPVNPLVNLDTLFTPPFSVVK